MTTPQIDFSIPLQMTLANGEVQSVRLDVKIPGHAVIASQLSAIAAAQASVPVYDLKKFEALSERKIIANTALTRSGVVVGL